VAERTTAGFLRAELHIVIAVLCVILLCSLLGGYYTKRCHNSEDSNINLH
jgi:uncharacterized membrane protein AbrB (regulator of aidB expression)